MSYIYEALKRAEDERQQGAVTARPAARPLSFATRPPWWVWGVLAALLANAVALAVFTVGRTPRTDSPVVARTEPSPPAIVTPRPSAPAPAAATPPIAPPAVARVVPRAERRDVPVSPAPVTPRAPTTKTPAIATAAPTAATSAPAAPTTAASTPAARPAVSVERPTEVAPREAPAAPPSVTRLAPSPGPVVVAPAPQVAPSPIELRLQVLVYSETPSQRMVFIDGRRYGEGDRIDANTVLERITAEGAVVNRGGQRFTITDRR